MKASFFEDRVIQLQQNRCGCGKVWALRLLLLLLLHFLQGEYKNMLFLYKDKLFL